MTFLSSNGPAEHRSYRDENAAPTKSVHRIVVVVGAGGEEEFESQFRTWADRWIHAAAKHGVDAILIDGDVGSISSLERLQAELSQWAESNNESVLWLVLIGHGTFDGTDAKFNLVGPDLSTNQLKEMLAPAEGKCVILGCFSASAPFINALSGGNRIVVSATKSGYEYNFSRFGDYLSRIVESVANGDLQYDLDKDEQVSLLEMVTTAARQTADFYAADKRLATEQALLDDNGDGLGAPLDCFRGVSPTRKARAGVRTDGLGGNRFFLFPNPVAKTWPADLLARRNELEERLEHLRSRKAIMSENDYYRELEEIALQLAELYRNFEQ
ncbi:MAG TPA: hypothetical protein PKA83_16700 [Pirellulaceae bacterium]|nr:hypothetical protein [Pirellulaceae bacterium]